MNDSLQQILIYGDSLTWGIVPQTRRRLPFDQRWPGVMENHLANYGLSVRVIEDCLNGRRSVWEDPFKAGRNGLDGLSQCIESNSPIALAIVMLGTNDFQSMHDYSAWLSAQGVATIVNTIRQAPIEPDMPIPPILVISPPPIGIPQGPIAPKFVGASAKCIGLSDALRANCEMLKCHFFDAATVATVSPIDGVHLDPHQHQFLGQAVAKIVPGILSSRTRQ